MNNKNVDLTEFSKVRDYLIENQIDFQEVHYFQKNSPLCNHHQIKVYKDGNTAEIAWDIICHIGSYGYEQGLVEVMGDIVPEDHEDRVMGFLTAEDVIKLVKRYKNL